VQQAVPTEFLAEGSTGPTPEATTQVTEALPPLVSPDLGSAEEVWVELPEAAAPKEPKPRSRRRKATVAAEPPTDAKEAEPREAVAEPEVIADGERAPAELPAVMLAVDNPPSPAVEPDPAEILSPPKAPRRGWWRRSS
jgi:ribonuclease E